MNYDHYLYIALITLVSNNYRRTLRRIHHSFYIFFLDKCYSPKRFNNSTIQVNKYHPRRAFNLYPTTRLNFPAKRLNNYPPKRLISQVSSYQAYVMDKHCFSPIIDSCSGVAVIRRKYRLKSWELLMQPFIWSVRSEIWKLREVNVVKYKKFTSICSK